jgi:tetratricopeptide (TPR) repeat protein
MTAIAQAFQAKDYARTVELGETQFAANPQKDLAFILFSSYAATNNGPKAAAYAAKVVEGFGPKDGINQVIWLTHYHANQKNADKAAEYGEMLLKTYPDSAPPGLSAEQANAEKAFAGMIQGSSAYGKKDYPNAVSSYTDSLKYFPKNDEAYYQIGMSHWRISASPAAADDAAKQKQQDLAIEAFAKAFVLGKARAAKAREYLELLYKPRHNNTLDGLDAFLAKAKSEVNP